jgi:hypothetical protein
VTKPRDPLTWDGAIFEAMHVAGVEVLSDRLDVSPSLIRQWADPDQKPLPILRQAEAIDVTCRDVAGRTPILDLYRHRVEVLASPSGACIQRLLMRAASDLGELAAAIDRAKADGVVCDHERIGIRQNIKALRDRLDAMDAECAPLGGDR